MRRPAAFAVVLLVAGCGGDDRTSPPRPAERAITARVDLDEPRAGAPDAGTRAGHGNDGVIGTTSSEVFSFTGKVSPASSRVRVRGGVVRVEPSGRFTVAVRSPASGSRSVRLEATHPEYRPWAMDVSVVRGAPSRVRVPERDDLAPTAALLVVPGGGAPVKLLASPSRAGEPPDMITLPRPSLRATAAVRDAEGGTGRIRLSMVHTTRCGTTERPGVRYLPPAQIVTIAIPPGASAPVERQRSALFELDVPDGCTVTGEVYAEGTDARGRQAVTHHAGFRYP